MKKFAKFLSVLLAVALLLSLAITAAAADAPATQTITITNAKAGKTYHAYQILAIESFKDEPNTTEDTLVTYKAAPGWADFVTGAGSDWLSVDTQGYVTPKTGFTNDTAPAFAAAALAYADGKTDINVYEFPEVTGDATTTAVTVPTGYYVIDSTVGTLLTANSTTGNITVTDKNVEPTVEGKVISKVNETLVPAGQEKETSTNVGDVVTYVVTIKAYPGGANYKLADTMTAGLTFNGIVSVTDSSNGAVPYTLAENPTAPHTFEMTIGQSYLDDLDAATVITVTYTATVNDQAVDTTSTNTVTLYYGNDPENLYEANSNDIPKVHTWNIPVAKYTTVGEGENALTEYLAGAEFKLTTDENGAQVLKFNQVGETTNYIYNAAGTKETITTNDTGKFILKGLDAGTYYLHEVTAPDGYNKLAAPVKIEIAETTGELKKDNATGTATEIGVLNQAGSRLPSTGGIGTTIFYIAGAVLVLGAGIVLIVRKRMSFSK